MKQKIVQNFDQEGAVAIFENSPEHRLILSEDGLLFLRNEEDIVLEHDIITSSNRNRFQQKLKFDVTYLDLRASFFNFKFKNYILKNINGNAVLFTQYLKPNNGLGAVNVFDLTREELERRFDPNNYDAMYLVNKRLGVLYALNKTDGILIDRELIPSDERILELDLTERENNAKLSNLICNDTSMGNCLVPTFELRTIDEVKDVNIYYSITSDYSDLLITMKNGKIMANWFNLSFLSRDKFRFVTKEETLFDSSTKLEFDVVQRKKQNKSKKVYLKNKNI